MRWLLLLIVAGLFGGAYYLLTLNFSNGPIEIGRGLLGITLPFAPFIAAIGLVLAGTTLAFATAVARR